MSTASAASHGGVLSERSPNTTSPTKSHGSTDKMVAAETFKPTTSEVKASQEQTYVSPSDNILSPTSKKLSEIKGKRFANVKSRSLFAKTVSKEGLKSQEKLNQFSRIE